MKTHQHIKLTKYDWLLYVSIIMVSGGQLINRFVKPVSDTAAYGLSGAVGASSLTLSVEGVP